MRSREDHKISAGAYSVSDQIAAKSFDHGAGVLGQIKGSDKKCFGVDGWVKPVMTSCDDSETTGETGLLVENSWYLIEYD